jgi:hypothetical protein
MFAENSLLNIRNKLRKREFPSSAPMKGIELTLADLKEQCSAKRRRICATRVKKSVTFDLDKNETYSRHASAEDLQSAWLSEHEATCVRQGMTKSVMFFRAGGVETGDNCLRGLEVHSNPPLMKAKISRNRSFTALILKQQSFLKSVSGSVNPCMLAKMSSMLSIDDVQYAIQIASNDAKSAYLLHAESLALKDSPPLFSISSVQCKRSGVQTTLDALNEAIELHVDIENL